MLSWARALVGVMLCVCFAAPNGGCTRLPELGGLDGLFRRENLRSARPLEGWVDPRLSIDHLQFKGSHNSYHRAPRFSLWPTWRYTHAPIETQLQTQGVRHLELDVRYEGGEVLVGHLPLVDGRSTCRRLDECLIQLKRWSKSHSSHLPVFVFIEPKENLVPSKMEGKLEAIDGEITRVFSRESLLLPEDVVGDASSMREAVLSRGWPSVEATRGRVAFVLFGPQRHRRAYARGRPTLQGRAMFVAGRAREPYAGIMAYDDPTLERSNIDRAVRQRFLVRTRADADLVKIKARRDAALESGAHFVSSDFVDPREGWLELGGTAPVRCNPVSAPERCTGRALAEIEDLLWAGVAGFTSGP